MQNIHQKKKECDAFLYSGFAKGFWSLVYKEKLFYYYFFVETKQLGFSLMEAAAEG